jgi:hypothetical protein
MAVKHSLSVSAGQRTHAANGRSILVLGMHRSGTSALTRVLNLLGADLGSELLKPGYSNEKGFWEHRAAYEQNDQLLLSLNRSWDDVRPLPEAWLEQPRTQEIRMRLVDAMRSDFATSGLWAVKDPRLCRLVPLWASVVAETGATPVAVLVVRHPAEIARSLMARNAMSFEHGCLLWAIYMLEAERDTRGMPRCAVTYDQLLDDWSTVATRVRHELAVPLQAPEACSAQVDSYLDRGERHHRADKSADAVPSWVERLYRCFIEVAEGRDRWGAIEEAGQDPIAIARHFASYTERLIVGVDMADRQCGRLMQPDLEEFLRQWAERTDATIGSKLEAVQALAEESVQEREAARRLMLQRIADLEGAVFERDARRREEEANSAAAIADLEERLLHQQNAAEALTRDLEARSNEFARLAQERLQEAQATIEALERRVADGDAVRAELQASLTGLMSELADVREQLRAADLRRIEAERRAAQTQADADRHLDLLMSAKDDHAREVEALNARIAMCTEASSAPKPASGFISGRLQAVTRKGKTK